MTQPSLPSQVRTPKMRIVFPNLFIPTSIGDDPNAKKQYSATLMIPKDDPNLLSFQQSVKAAQAFVIDKYWGNRPPNKLTYQIFDGDTFTNQRGETQEIFFGHWFVRAKANNPPMVVKRVSNGQFEPIKEHEIKGGDYVFGALGFYAYDNKQYHKAGVSINLDGVCLVAEGEPLANRRVIDPTETFGDAPTMTGQTTHPHDKNDAWNGGNSGGQDDFHPDSFNGNNGSDDSAPDGMPF